MFPNTTIFGGVASLVEEHSSFENRSEGGGAIFSASYGISAFGSSCRVAGGDLLLGVLMSLL